MIVFFFLLSWFTVCTFAFPTCGDCWGIPDNNGLDPCPSWVPQTDFSNDTIEEYKNQIPESIYSLNCNPYRSSNCSTTPPQIFLDKETAVCGFLYSNATNSCEIYSPVTFASKEDAIVSGAIVTHTGSCGVCSTAQDLAVYLSKTPYINFGLIKLYLIYHFKSGGFYCRWQNLCYERPY